MLLVEDDPIVARMYSKLFIAEGFEVHVIDNGQDCLSATIYFHPDIIILDIMMPKMNGLDVLNALRFHDETKLIPVIVQTNLSDKTYEEEALRRGAVKYIVKSQIENKKLVNIIRDVLKRPL